MPNLYQSFGHSIFGQFIPVFWEKLLEKIQNGHIWPNLYQSFGKMGKIVGKNLEQPFLAIPNLYQSFGNCQKKIGTIFGHSKFIPVLLGKIVRKNWNNHFWPFLIYTSLSGKNCWKKFGTTIFGHSKFIPVFLGNIVRKRLEQTFLAIPNLYQSFWETLSEKDWNKHFWPFLIYTSLSGKNCWKKLEWPFLAIPNLYQSS